jgi:hypothetical protein
LCCAISTNSLIALARDQMRAVISRLAWALSV